MKKRYVIALLISLIVLGLTYKFWLIFKTSTSARFDFYPFCIILVLSYLGGLKLTDYLADFKDLKHQSRIEIIFLTVFFILLFIPMSHIDQNKSSKLENRNLATYKPLFNKHQKINYNFGKDFDKWYSDRFQLRRGLIYTYYLSKMYVNAYLNVNNIRFIKKNNWILHTPSTTANNIDLNSQYGKYLKELQNFCDKENIKLYIITSPKREDILIDKYLYINKTSEDLIPQEPKGNLNIIYPYKELMEASKHDYVYFKTDHHWTDYGAYIISNILLTRIQKDFPQVKLVEKKDYKLTSSKLIKSEFNREYREGVEIYINCPFLIKYAEKILDTEYIYYTHNKSNLLKIETFNNEKRKGKDYYYPLGTDLTVVQIGTSMNENLNDFLPYQFKRIHYYRLNGPKGRKEEENFKVLKYYKKDIIKLKPDIMIFCLEFTQLKLLKTTLED